jgi:quercetin dioxygenase-like cupin family protein
MRITAADLRIVRREGMTVRFAPMGPVAYVIAELTSAGSAGTSFEAPCTEPHWGLLLHGEMDVLREGQQPVRLVDGQAFHVPAGDPPHRFVAPGQLTAVGFAPIASPDIDAREIQRLGYEVVDEPATPAIRPAPLDISIAGTSEVIPLRRGEIESEASLMGPWVLCATRFGSVSGYSTSWCDQSHWGTVLRGTVAIEWEHEMEIIGTGEAFYCPPGPPGHRIEVTDSATVMDFTPLTEMVRAGRVAAWRPRLSIVPPAVTAAAGSISDR